MCVVRPIRSLSASARRGTEGPDELTLGGDASCDRCEMTSPATPTATPSNTPTPTKRGVRDRVGYAAARISRSVLVRAGVLRLSEKLRIRGHVLLGEVLVLSIYAIDLAWSAAPQAHRRASRRATRGHAGDREQGWGEIPLPAAHVRMESAGRSSRQPISSVPRDAPMWGARGFHRCVPAL